MALIKTIRGFTPKIADSVFLAETAVVIGEVEIGEQSSIWYNVVLRGDVHSITVGARTNIQDGAIVHCTYQKAFTVLGDDVTIGHKAMLHGCEIQSRSLVGMGAIVMDGAVVESNAIVAPGAVALEGTRVESGFLYGGLPAKKIKPLSEAQIAGIGDYSEHYLMYSSWYREVNENA